MSYFDNVNPDLLARIDSNALRICEFGYGAGALARAIKQKNSEVHYTGVEIAAEPLRQAGAVLDVALQRDLDQVPDWRQDHELSTALPEGVFDHVIFGDVLEHLYDPENVLRQSAQLLAPQGSLLACIPNVQHWSVFVQLVSGSWPRMNSGLFDQTHIRWFTLHDMLQLMQGAGLEVKVVVPRIFDHEQGIAVMEYLEPLAVYLGANVDQLMQCGLPLQYVLVASRAS